MQYSSAGGIKPFTSWLSRKLHSLQAIQFQPRMKEFTWLPQTQGSKEENPPGAKALAGWMKQEEEDVSPESLLCHAGSAAGFIPHLEALRTGQAAKHPAAACLLAVML